MKNKLAEAKLYANAAYMRNKNEACNCYECRQKEAAEKLAQVQRIIAARTPPQEAKVIQIERRRK